MCHNPQDPNWPNRDRFILSAGHGSALLYALLHLSGYDLSMDEIKNFRQWGSQTPGHPEYRDTPGVEMTTGPLGQGFATGVGMALAERFIRSHYSNGSQFSPIDHYTYAIVSDGDLMEGVSSEAAALAGHLGLGRLIYLYDSNSISIEGSTELAFSENVEQRFVAAGWQVLDVDDGNDTETINAAIELAKKETTKPSLIVVHTHIGFGSPKQDSEESHGAPLGKEAVKATKAFFDWDVSQTFVVPDDVREHMGQPYA